MTAEVVAKRMRWPMRFGKEWSKVHHRSAGGSCETWACTVSNCITSSGRRARHAALGRDSKILHVAAGRRDPLPGPARAVGGMDEAEIELGAGRKLQVLQRLEIAIVGARHR